MSALAVLLVPFLLADLAVVTLSSGERIEGAFELPEGRKLDVYDVERKRRIALDPQEVVRISVSVEEERLEQGWMFKEDGDHEKVKLPFRYPLRKLLTAVTLASGETVRGHVACSFRIETDGSSRRLLLLADQKGEKGQSLEDLVYVREVVLPARAAGAARKLGEIKLAWKGPAAIASVEREATFQPPFGGLLAGRYDVFLFGERSVRYGLSGEPVGAADVAALERRIAPIEEFYPKKRIVAAARAGKLVRALVELERPVESHDAGWHYARWELWTFEPTQSSWDVKRRLFLHRARFAAAQGIPAFDYKAEARLAGVSENAVIEEGEDKR